MILIPTDFNSDSIPPAQLLASLIQIPEWELSHHCYSAHATEQFSSYPKQTITQLQQGYGHLKLLQYQ